MTADGEAQPCWQHLVEVDLGAIRRARDRMKIALSRYGRTPIDHWDHRDIAELAYWHGLLRELMESEGAVRGLTEE